MHRVGGPPRLVKIQSAFSWVRMWVDRSRLLNCCRHPSRSRMPASPYGYDDDMMVVAQHRLSGIRRGNLIRDTRSAQLHHFAILRRAVINTQTYAPRQRAGCCTAVVPSSLLHKTRFSIAAARRDENIAAATRLASQHRRAHVIVVIIV